jgi:site-specific DNA recombinase
MAEKHLTDGTTALAAQPRVIKIEAAEKPENARLRVAAYTRVSSDSDDQLNSFAAQNRYYATLISGKAEWRMVDIYADEGITGTSAAKREDFQRMMADCRRGLIDQILVKSISRFARNTKDCLEAVRELKELGVNVRFEREGIDTANVSSELITAIYAAFAQKESESISGNMRWSYQRRMEAGTFLPSSMAYGYKLVGRKIEIDAGAALVVCRIFQWYLNGVNRTAIAKKLNEEGISSGQCKKWHDASVRYILTNEKYTGDSLWQKTYTSDTLPTTRHKNKGEHEQYYAVGTHPPIIPREIFDQAQNLLQKRETDYRKRNCPGSHPLTGKIVCGSTFRRKEYRGNIRWACMGHERSGKDCPITPISGKTIYEAFCRLYYKLKHQSLPILEQMLETLQTIRDCRLLWSEDIVSLNKKISELSSQNQTLAFLKQNGLVDPDIFISKSNELARQLRQAKLDKEKLMAAEGDATAQRTRELIALLEDGPDFLDRPDTELCGALVAEIIVESNDTLRFRLHNGLELRESIERTVR